MDKPFGKPSEPVISRSECIATLKLVHVMLQNIVACGDLPERILERIQDFEMFIAGLGYPITRRDSERLGAAIACGLLPSFEPSEPQDAGEALMTLISLGAKKPVKRAA